MSPALFTSTLAWRRASTPPPPECEEVLVLTLSGESGQAMHDAGQWWWSDGHEILDVVAWAKLPDGAQLNITQADVLYGQEGES